MSSVKEQTLDAKIIGTLEAFGLTKKALPAAKLMLTDREIQAYQECANTVSILRLGYNDHGPVHMRTVVLNIIIMMELLRQDGIVTSLEKEKAGDFEDSLVAAIFAGMLHDLGMSVGRQEHELHSTYMAAPIIDRLLSEIYTGKTNSSSMHKKIMIRSLALEGISGHMGTRTIHSLEAGVVQVADGCDMTKGRARIPMSLEHTPRGGSIHQYSAGSIEEVRISLGQEKPIRIEVLMSSEVGVFQIEEVLLRKISSSTAKPHIELYAQLQDGNPKKYL
ncbi:MAG: phosphohydrolase [Treponema sp.]|nr:phosphohydrolase [Treponema sp.]